MMARKAALKMIFGTAFHKQRLSAGDRFADSR
jgi:hypothetical protein